MHEKSSYGTVQKILDYWYTMEFLGQDPLPRLTREEERSLRMAEAGSSKCRFLHIIRPFTEAERVLDAVKADLQRYHMERWGNLTLYIGKSRREVCVRRLAEALGQKYDPPEKNLDEIAWCSFQLNEAGRYLQASFSLSRPIWALNRAAKQSRQMQEGFLDEEVYRDQIREYDEFLSQMDMSETYGMTREGLEILYDKIRKAFLDTGETEQTSSFYCLLEYQLFPDKEAEDDWRDDGYRGLGIDFYSDDLKMVQERLKKDGKQGELPMLHALKQYITAGYTSFHPEKDGMKKFPWLMASEGHAEKEKYRRSFWANLLDIRSGSLGKWPSRFMPAFMQQAAVNLFMHIGDTFYGENIFSVNGPPGTGKTTLIKEIAAHNIVERATLLADYEEPDEAFIECSFRHGKDKNDAYASDAPHYYRLRDERINDYGILVVSSNNVAVENITKELPMEDKICRTLQEDAGDGSEMKRQLKEIRELFTVEKSSMEEELYAYETEKNKFYKEIYFSKYAQELLEEKQAVWGLISAPLGKRGNIRNFYWKVLRPLHNDFYVKQKSEDRLIKYQAARRRFLRQRDRVRKLQSELSEYCQLECDMRNTYIDLKERIQRITNEIAIKRSQREEYQKKEAELRVKLTEATEAWQIQNSKLQKVQEDYAFAKHKLQQADLLYKEKLSEAVAVWGRTGITRRLILNLLFKNSAKAKDDLEQTYKAEAAQAERDVETWKRLVIHLEEVKAAEMQAYEKSTRERKHLACELKSLEKEIEKLQTELEEGTLQIERAEEACERQIKSYHEIIRSRVEGAEETERFTALDQEFMRRVFSGETQEKTAAQTKNLWYTQKYNREREKLFFYALQMNREFVLASDCCRQNFLNLSMLWGERKVDNRRVSFHPDDRADSTAPLMQSLFLLVPVISTTFASVGRFLKDIKTPGAIGTLVVDEAGQAQPQYAVGALYRSRKAIIVGDPRQIEPIVNDELEILKGVYKENIYNAYKKRSISVQRLADYMNPYGIWSESQENGLEWLGCPLKVHRRCITPMYEIANEISYNYSMLQQTADPAPEEEKNFCYPSSRWINIAGCEEGEKDHYVKEQGERVLEILERAFEKSDAPKLFIITPFDTVKKGLMRYIHQYLRKDKDTKFQGKTSRLLTQKEKVKAWIHQNIGTVHSFQGKEADEVIFLLGCDKGKAAEGAIRWVTSNIVNVAVTRAKYRLYVIGDFGAWKKSPYISRVKAHLDLYAIRALSNLEKTQEGDRDIVCSLFYKLPSAESFEIANEENEEGEIEYVPHTEEYLRELQTIGLFSESLTEEQLQIYGYTAEAFRSLNEQIRNNIEWGIKLHRMLSALKKQFSIEKLDGSCCGILFCKAVELYMKEYFLEGMKKQFPDFKVKGKRKLQEVEKKEVTLGTFGFLLKQPSSPAKLAAYLKEIGMEEYTESWWGKFKDRLQACTDCRNECCHSDEFRWNRLDELLNHLFLKEQTGEEPRIKGLLNYREVGEKLAE